MSVTELAAFLQELGLTEYEAKTLTSLFKLKEAEAPQVSQASQVPKTRVYDILERLTKKGLIIEVSGRPKKYKALETQKAFDILLNEAKAKTKNLEEKAAVLKSMFSEEALPDDAERVMKVKDKQDFARILLEEIESAKKSISGFSGFVFEHTFLLDALHKAKLNNVDVRLLSKGNASAVHGKSLAEKGIEVKEAQHGLEAFILDGKKVILSISDLAQQKNGYHFTIWPDNTHMAVALTHYFDRLWAEAQQA